MTQITLREILDEEIQVLNKRIDRKIERGRSYYKDAQKHQALVTQYRRIALRRKMAV